MFSPLLECCPTLGWFAAQALLKAPKTLIRVAVLADFQISPETTGHPTRARLTESPATAVP